MLERHAKKGRLVHAEGKLQTRRWSKPDEDGDRFSTEILVVPGHKVQFLDKPNRANGNGAQPATEPANGGGHAGRWRARVDGRFRRLVGHPLLGDLPPSASGSRRHPASAPLFCSRLRVRRRSHLAPALRAALNEARAVLALPASPGRASGAGYRRHAGAAPTRSRGGSRATASRRCASVTSFAVARARPSGACRCWLRRAETQGIPVFNLAHLPPRHVNLRAAIVRRSRGHLQRRGRVRRRVPFAIAHCERRCAIQGKDWARRFATGLPCRARCAVSTLRAGIPRASGRCAPCALRLPRAPAWRGELSSRRIRIVTHVLSAPTR